MPPRHEPPRPVPAIADPGVILRLQMSLGEQDGMLQVEGYIDRDATQAEYDALADKMRATARRQRAIQTLPVLRRQLDQVEHEVRENKARLARSEAEEKVFREEIDKKVAELREEHRRRHDAAYVEHQATRRGEFKPQGHVRAELDRIQKDIDSMEGAWVARRNMLIESRNEPRSQVEQGERNIVQLKRLIVEEEALAGDAAARS